MRAITISRTKTVVNLPGRVDEIHHLEFSSEERDMYNAANRETIALIEEAISSGRESGKTFNALTRLNFLRLFCNLGHFPHRRSASATTSATTSAFRECGSSFSQSADYGLLYSDVLDGSAACAQCGHALLDDLLEGVSSPDFDNLPAATYAPSLCDNCRSDPNSRQSDLMPFFQREHSNASAASSTPSTPSDQTQSLLPIELMPTKIKALVADLSKHCPTVKR